MYTITLEVNQICNLRCTYCYLGRKTNQKMSEQIAYKGLEIAFLNAENHRDRRLWVDFVGGEALLSLSFLKHLVDYIEGQALKRNILVTYSITTNGTILNDECKLCLNGMPVPLLRNCYSIFNGTKYR